MPHNNKQDLHRCLPLAPVRWHLKVTVVVIPHTLLMATMELRVPIPLAEYHPRTEEIAISRTVLVSSSSSRTTTATILRATKLATVLLTWVGLLRSTRSNRFPVLLTDSTAVLL